MTSAPHAVVPSPQTCPDSPRLQVKPAQTGHVDGGWWPRSGDLPRELEAALPALAERLGAVERISYHLGDWDTTVRSMIIDGTRIRMAGYEYQPTGTVDVLGARERLTLVVFPPAGPAERTRAAIVTASQADDTHAAADLLSAAAGS